MAIYKPARAALTHRKLRDLSNTDDSSKDELRILMWLHGPGNVPSLISLIESIQSTKKSMLKLFIMHLVELTEQSSSIIMVQQARKNGFPFFNLLRRGKWHYQVVGAFQAYSQLGRVSVRPTMAISALSTMHEDICHMAKEKRVAMIVLPFHKSWTGEGDKATEDNVGHRWRGVNQRVLKHAPCSVAVFMDHGFWGGSETARPDMSVVQRVCILFFSGPDDREVLELGGRMAEHPAVKVTMVRFVEKPEAEGSEITLRPSLSKCREKSYCFSIAHMNREKEKELDKAAVVEFRERWDGTVSYTEKVAGNVVEEVLVIGQSKDYHLVVLGKGRFPSAMVVDLANRPAEHPELGPIGDVLVSSSRGIACSVLVIQQPVLGHGEETPRPGWRAASPIS